MNQLHHSILSASMKKILGNILYRNNYDSVNNFIEFYNQYRKSTLPLADFFHSYEPPICTGKHTCVGLSLTLMRRMKFLNIQFPGICNSASLLSCEESVSAEILKYVTSVAGPHKLPFVSAQKEHVVVGIRIVINGREGIMVSDPGYHIGKVITIMRDQRYPHTGTFVQHRSTVTLKQFNYHFNNVNKNFVEWHEHEDKNGKEKYRVTLIFTGLPYKSAIDVTEKRNIVYTFKSIVKRDTKGNAIAGFYFPLTANFENASFTVFIGLNAKANFYFKDFSDPRNLHKDLIEIFNLVAKLMDCSPRYLTDTICKLAKIMANEKFMNDVLDINTQIRLSCQ